MTTEIDQLGTAKGSDVETEQYVSFWVDGQLLGVHVESVQEVLNPQRIARVPKAQKEIAGLLNLRGQIVTAVDLRKRLGLDALEEGKASMNVVVKFQDEPFSILVDEVGDVIDVPSNAVGQVPRTLDEHWKAVTEGVVRLEERLFIVLNIEAILTLGSRKVRTVDAA